MPSSLAHLSDSHLDDLLLLASDPRADASALGKLLRPEQCAAPTPAPPFEHLPFPCFLPQSSTSSTYGKRASSRLHSPTLQAQLSSLPFSRPARVGLFNRHPGAAMPTDVIVDSICCLSSDFGFPSQARQPRTFSNYVSLPQCAHNNQPSTPIPPPAFSAIATAASTPTTPSTTQPEATAVHKSLLRDFRPLSPDLNSPTLSIPSSVGRTGLVEEMEQFDLLIRRASQEAEGQRGMEPGREGGYGGGVCRQDKLGAGQGEDEGGAEDAERSCLLREGGMRALSFDADPRIVEGGPGVRPEPVGEAVGALHAVLESEAVVNSSGLAAQLAKANYMIASLRDSRARAVEQAATAERQVQDLRQGLQAAEEQAAKTMKEAAEAAEEAERKLQAVKLEGRENLAAESKRFIEQQDKDRALLREFLVGSNSSSGSPGGGGCGGVSVETVDDTARAGGGGGRRGMERFWKEMASLGLNPTTVTRDSLPLDSFPLSVPLESSKKRMGVVLKTSQREVKRLRRKLSEVLEERQALVQAKNRQRKDLEARVKAQESIAMGAVRRVQWLLVKKKGLEESLQKRDSYIRKVEAKLLQLHSQLTTDHRKQQEKASSTKRQQTKAEAEATTAVHVATKAEGKIACVRYSISANDVAAGTESSTCTIPVTSASSTCDVSNIEVAQFEAQSVTG